MSPLCITDLDTENPGVISELNKWISWLVKEFDFDGIRMDTVKHVRRDFWDAFTRSSGVFSVGEVAHGSSDFVGPYQGSHMDSTLGYPLFEQMHQLYSNPGANMYRMRDALNNDRKFFNDTR